MTYAVYSLPVPPSTNNLFASAPGRGRVKTPHYTRWLTQAGWLIKLAKQPKIEGAYKLRITVPQKTRADLDNMIKPLVDVLVSMGATSDDKHLRSISIRREEAEKAALVIVEPA